MIQSSLIVEVSTPVFTWCFIRYVHSVHISTCNKEQCEGLATPCLFHIMSDRLNWRLCMLWLQITPPHPWNSIFYQDLRRSLTTSLSWLWHLWFVYNSAMTEQANIMENSPDKHTDDGVCGPIPKDVKSGCAQCDIADKTVVIARLALAIYPKFHRISVLWNVR